MRRDLDMAWLTAALVIARRGAHKKRLISSMVNDSWRHWMHLTGQALRPTGGLQSSRETPHRQAVHFAAAVGVQGWMVVLGRRAWTLSRMGVRDDCAQNN